MGLETPLALLGLLLAVLPWLAHRIRRRDLVPVPLPTFALLLEAEHKKKRKRGLADLLLLLLRIALVSAAAIALAAPYVSARLHFGDGSLASVAIVLDDSMSMLREDGSSNLLEAARARARDVIASLPEGSEVAIVLAGSPARVLHKRSLDLPLALLALDQIAEAPPRATDMSKALALCADQLASAAHGQRRVLVLSDMAAHTGLTARALEAAGADVTLERMGSAAASSNLYIESVTAALDPSMQGQTSVVVEIASSGSVPERVPVRISARGRDLATQEVELKQGRARATLRVPSQPGTDDPTALVQLLARDVLELDNAAGVLLRGSDALRVLFVNGDPHPASRADELHYALLALRHAPTEAESFSTRAIDASALAAHDLADTDVVVLANVPAPSAPLRERLETFVNGGGGLLIAPGERFAPRSIVGGLMPCDARARIEQKSQGIVPDAQASWLAQGATGLSAVRISSHFALECDGPVALRFSDGAPALAVKRMGRGSVALLALPLDADFSDLPLHPGYMPLLVAILRELGSQAGAQTPEVVAGEPVEITIPAFAKRLELALPDGTRETLEAENDARSVTFTRTNVIGSYRTIVSTTLGSQSELARGAFVVRAPEGESDLSPLTELPALVRGARASAGATLRKPLAAFWLLLLGLFALTEGALRLRR